MLCARAHSPPPDITMAQQEAVRPWSTFSVRLAMRATPCDESASVCATFVTPCRRAQHLISFIMSRSTDPETGCAGHASVQAVLRWTFSSLPAVLRKGKVWPGPLRRPLRKFIYAVKWSFGNLGIEAFERACLASTLLPFLLRL